MISDTTTDAAQSGTPRTDAEEFDVGITDSTMRKMQAKVVSGYFARTLERESCTLAARVAALEAELQQYRNLRTDKGAVRVNLLQGLLACPDDLIFIHDTQGPYAKLMAKHATAEQSALAANERAEAAEKKWIALSAILPPSEPQR